MDRKRRIEVDADVAAFSRTLAAAMGPAYKPRPLTRRQALLVWVEVLWLDVVAPILIVLLALAASAGIVLAFAAAARYGWEIAG